MKCPFCTSTSDKVIETRETRESDSIRRRRECLECGSRYSTIENVVFNYPLVIKKDGRREEFSSDKLRRGIQAACQKRPIPSLTIEELVKRTQMFVLLHEDKEIPSRTIGEKIMNELRQIDDVAFVRFASVYRTFQDVKSFTAQLDPLENSSSANPLQDTLIKRDNL
jgi:transcriptional repressor NrdR